MERMQKQEEQKQVAGRRMDPVQMARVVGNQAAIHMDSLQRENHTDAIRNVSLQKAESSKVLKYPIIVSNNVVQCSLLGKLGTLLGTGVFAGLGGALSIPMGVSALPAAAVAAGTYLLGKKIFGGPFIGGKDNIGVLERGKRSPQVQRAPVGIGLTHKRHMVSHNVGSINGVHFDQTTDGALTERQLICSMTKPLMTPNANARVDVYDDFDPVRGRMAFADLHMQDAVNGLNKLNETRRRQGDGVPYRLGTNDCRANVTTPIAATGLTPPFYAKTPYLTWLWMKGIHMIQNKFL